MKKILSRIFLIIIQICVREDDFDNKKSITQKKKVDTKNQKRINKK